LNSLKGDEAFRCFWDIVTLYTFIPAVVIFFLILMDAIVNKKTDNSLTTQSSLSILVKTSE